MIMLLVLRGGRRLIGTGSLGAIALLFAFAYSGTDIIYTRKPRIPSQYKILKR